MTDNINTPRAILHKVVQESMNHDSDTQGNVVTGWICIAESMDQDGQRCLSSISSDASGERKLPRWTEQGLLHNGLHGDGTEGWDTKEEDDES